MDNELLLFDRLEVIKTTIQTYGEENFYISFSGGKDSTVVHHLVDMALPDNKIPRVFINTGIEYNEIVKFVRKMADNDERFVLIKPSKPIKKTLEKYGYPFKSKQYSQWYQAFIIHRDQFNEFRCLIDKNPELINDYGFIHNLPNGVKWIVKEYYGRRERDGKLYEYNDCSEVLKYQFDEGVSLKISDKCCLELKEKPLDIWGKKQGKNNHITGLTREEGGRRSNIGCILVKKNKIAFHPLAKVNSEWIEWFIQEHNIELCALYYEPYNFVRTGCKGCPFALTLQEQLETMERYFPAERKQCEIIWKPVYDEYRRLGYRLKKDEQLKLF